MQRIVQRLYTQSIPCQQQTLPPLIPDRNRKHSPELANTLGPKFFVQMNNNLGIATGIETVTTGLQSPPQLWKIVNFAIENHPDALVLVVYRLVAPGHIDDAQPPHPQPYAIAHIEPFVVRTPMHYGVAHQPNASRHPALLGFES